MVERGAESILYSIVDSINELLLKSEANWKLGVDIEDRERYILIKEVKKKQYYGLIRLYTIKSGEDKSLIWREEVTFYNLTERRKSLTWRDYLAKICLFEALGSFVAITKARVEERTATLIQGNHGKYRWKEDFYENISVEVKEGGEEEADDGNQSGVIS